MTQQANKKTSERIFYMGEIVYIKLQPYRQQSIHKRVSHKLKAKYYGPYQLLRKLNTYLQPLQFTLSFACPS